MSNRYNTRVEVYVNPFPNSGIAYGFPSAISEEGKRTALGQVLVNRAALPPGLVFGANAPKPGRATKTFATETNTSFYSIENAAALAADGWRLSFPTIRRARAGAKTVAVYVTIGTIKYAWMMPDELHTQILDDMAALGVQEADINDRNLVWGARYPKPPRGASVVIGAQGRNILSTFVDPDKADSLPPGWSMTGKEYA